MCRLWHQLLQTTLFSLGFEHCATDSYLYLNVGEDGATLVGTYVSDFLVTDTTERRVDDFYKCINSFKLKPSVSLRTFLGCGWDLASTTTS